MSENPVLILGVETSCDETAAAVVDHHGRVLSSIVSSQHDLHGKYGGVVPELASRRQIESVERVTQEAMRVAGITWSDLQAIAVTRGPGLAGALLVGVSFAKGLAYAMNVPLIGVNHLEGHIASAWIEDPAFPRPCVVLVVSGGHTHLFLAGEDGSFELLGQTLDDASGEAFDKAAKMLGLEYPGGPAVDRLARSGNARAVALPRAHLKKGSLDFSFSGVKTALLYHLRDLDARGETRCLPDLAASFQEAVVEVLVEKAFAALKHCRVGALAVVGGVSANSRLRGLLTDRAKSEGIRLSLPPLCYCTDNAAMIALAGLRLHQRGLQRNNRASAPSSDQLNGERAGFDAWDMESDAELPVPAAPGPRKNPSRGGKQKRRRVAG